MCSTSKRPVLRRKVFFIPGYDPLPPRRYRELYRTEAAAQAGISGYHIETSGQPKAEGGFGWQVKALIDDQTVETDIEVLVWSDLVRASFQGSIWKTYVALFRTARIYIQSGALFRLMQLRKGPVIAALYPVLMLIAQLATALIAGWAAFRLITWAVTAMTDGGGQALAGGLASAIGAVVVWAVLYVFKSRDAKVFAHYLMHDFSFSSAHAGAYSPELETRLAQFGERIAEALQAPVDEVLVVGHSSGAHLGVSLLADTLRQHTAEQGGPALAFLSLGQVVPMVSFLPKATRLRRDLQLLSTAPQVAWVDVTAPGDGCCFALCDPVAVSGQETPEKRGPLVFSAAFTQTLSPARWKELRWRFFRLHLQYLCAFDRPKDYDYFQITAGPLLLADRFEGRPASKSRIERSVTRYTATAP